MAHVAKMAKFGEKSRFLRKKKAGYARKCVRKRLKNAVGRSQTRRVFQKVTVGVSLVKLPMRQNEMGGLIAKKNHPRNCGRCAVNICVWRLRNKSGVTFYYCFFFAVLFFGAVK